MRGDGERVNASAVVVAILLGGVVAGALDIAYAFTASGLMRGTQPLTVLQAIASGLLGREAFRGGVEAGVLGGALHFFMTTVMAGVFVLASLALPWLRERAVQWGLIYGGGIFLVMNYIVVPLSRAAGRIPPVEVYAAGFVVHMLLVGLPIALIARLYLGPRR
jgi:hypothetical protein